MYKGNILVMVNMQYNNDNSAFCVKTDDIKSVFCFYFKFSFVHLFTSQWNSGFWFEYKLLKDYIMK
jgi:hypothetical protein